MATAPTIYQKKQSARRATADIERLAKTYQSGLFDVTQQQQNAFTSWQQQSKEAMAPYEAAVNKYTSVDFPAYQSQLKTYQDAMAAYDQQASAYRQRLDAFNQTLRDYEANPTEVVNAQYTDTRQGRVYILAATPYNERNLPPGYFIQETPRQVTNANRSGGTYTTTVYDKQLVKNRPIPKFTEQAPTAPNVSMPTAPTAPGAPPTIAPLDTSEFEKKRKELTGTLEREVGERKAAKQNVVMRRMGRSMLQGE